jgi:hypothetical protein
MQNCHRLGTAAHRPVGEMMVHANVATHCPNNESAVHYYRLSLNGILRSPELRTIAIQQIEA